MRLLLEAMRVLLEAVSVLLEAESMLFKGICRPFPRGFEIPIGSFDSYCKLSRNFQSFRVDVFQLRSFAAIGQKKGVLSLIGCRQREGLRSSRAYCPVIL